MAIRILDGLMMMAPIAALAVIAASGRAQSEPDDIETAREGHRRIRAYVDPMREIERLRVQRAGEAPPSRMREVADRWIALAERGVLTDLAPTDAHDTSRDGVKSEIFRGKNSLVHKLLDMAAKGDPRQAAADYVRAYRLALVGKYSDLVSLTMTARTELAALRGLAEVARRLSRQEKARIRAAIESIDLETTALSSVFRRARALIIDQDLFAGGREADAGPVLDRFASLLCAPGNHKELARLQLAAAVRHPETLSALSLARLAYAQRWQTLAARERALRALSAR